MAFCNHTRMENSESGAIKQKLDILQQVIQAFHHSMCIVQSVKLLTTSTRLKHTAPAIAITQEIYWNNNQNLIN